MTNDGQAPGPTVIGRFQVLRTLGQGGMGSVYLAKDPSIDRLVALKLMRTGFERTEMRERFAREARAVGRLHHPNIVTIFEFGEHKGEPFIAMEYVEGQTLASLVGRADVTPVQVLALMDGIFAGLHYAHRAGIIHRDVKPVNVMVDGEGIVKILDFGIARAVEMDLTQAGTQPGTIIGTLNYMAPEQLTNKPVDHRADIFAAGAVFYELLAGAPAFPGDLPGVLHLILTTGPKPLSEVRSDLDPALVAIVNRCLERDPERRYPDLGAARKDLAALQHGDAPRRAAGATVILRPGDAPPPLMPPPVPASSAGSGAPKGMPGTLDQQVVEARRALEREEYTVATDACRRVLDVDPKHRGAVDLQAELNAALQARAWLADGQRELERGALTAATALVERALTLRPGVPEGLRLRTAIDEARRAQQSAASGPAVHAPDGVSASSGSGGQSASAPVAPASGKSGGHRIRRLRWRSHQIGILVMAAVIVAIAASIYIGTRMPVRRSAGATPDHSARPASAPPPVTPPDRTVPVAKGAPVPPANAAPASRPPITTPAPDPAPPKPPPATPPSSASGSSSSSVSPAPAATSSASPPPAPRSTGAASAAPVATPPASPAVPPGDRGRGTRAGLRGAPTTPFPAAERNCMAGDAHACTEVGMGFKNGRGTVRDDVRAVEFFQRGCGAGDLTACVSAGELYANGEGLTRDLPYAVALYQRGCDGNAPLGCLLLGQLYASGRGVERDDKHALDLFFKGCDGNNAVACSEAGTMLVSPRGPQHDDRKAASVFKKACDANYAPACTNLGLLYRAGRGVPKEPALALQLFTKACDAGEVAACRFKNGG